MKTQKWCFIFLITLMLGCNNADVVIKNKKGKSGPVSVNKIPNFQIAPPKAILANGNYKLTAQVNQNQQVTLTNGSIKLKAEVLK